MKSRAIQPNTRNMYLGRTLFLSRDSQLLHISSSTYNKEIQLTPYFRGKAPISACKESVRNSRNQKYCISAEMLDKAIIV